LLGRDKQHCRIAKPNLVKRFVPFRQREQTIDCDAASDPLPLQARDLVSHKRHQG
jgi:hypothetical protein